MEEEYRRPPVLRGFEPGYHPGVSRRDDGDDWTGEALITAKSPTFKRDKHGRPNVRTKVKTGWKDNHVLFK